MSKKVPIGLASVLLVWVATANGQCSAGQPAAVCGRPVRVVSVAMYNQGLEKTAQAIDREGAAGADVILLTETWQGQGHLSALDDPAMTRMAALAKKHHTYIISPVDRKDGDTVYNSAVLFDRRGKVVGIYNKMCPVLDDPPGVGGEFKGRTDGRPGHDEMVFETDFGRIGMAICFDAQFPEVWQRLEENGAQLVLFSVPIRPAVRWEPMPRCTIITSSPPAGTANARRTTSRAKNSWTRKRASAASRSTWIVASSTTTIRTTIAGRKKGCCKRIRAWSSISIWPAKTGTCCGRRSPASICPR